MRLGGRNSSKWIAEMTTKYSVRWLMVIGVVTMTEMFFGDQPNESPTLWN